MSKAVEIEGYMLRVHTRYYDSVNGVVVCKKGENDKMFFPFRRPHGEWIYFEDDDYASGGYNMCSVCNWKFSFGAYPLIYVNNYCPHCGASMVKEGEAE